MPKRPGCTLTSTPKNRKAQRNNRKKKRREINKELRGRSYDKPLGWNPQLQEEVVNFMERKKNRMLKGMGYKTPVPTE